MPYKREFVAPAQQSFFLFGPRGVGKSTWLLEQFKPNLYIDLLKSNQFLELSAEPEKLEAKVRALKKGSKVVIDEIQKLPQLLDEVQSLIYEFKDQIQFVMTGSSARKLKKSKSNLLAGRALKKQFWGLNSFELGSDFNLESVLSFGSLPAVVNLNQDNQKIDHLMTYVDLYLKEEIQAEAAVRNLSSYHRFLKHAALMNGQVLNLNTISREASVARSTLDGYFSIVDDTLLGQFLEPIHLSAKVKEVSMAKFYFFDCGVVRALRNDLNEPIADSDKGFLLETFIYNELLSVSSYHSKHWQFNYWGTPSKNEIDFIMTQGKKHVGVEVKNSKKWSVDFHKTMLELVEAKKLHKGIGLYNGKDKLKYGPIEVYPIKSFLDELHVDPNFLFTI